MIAYLICRAKVAVKLETCLYISQTKALLSRKRLSTSNSILRGFVAAGNMLGAMGVGRKLFVSDHDPISPTIVSKTGTHASDASIIVREKSMV